MTRQDSNRPAGQRGDVPLRASIVTGIVVFAVVFLATIAFAFLFPREYEATATAVVIPRSDLTPELEAGYYDILNQGTIVSTFAETINDRDLDPDTLTQLGIPEDDAEEIDVKVSPVSGTSMLQVVTKAPKRDWAIGISDAVMKDSETFIAGLQTPFQFTDVGSAKANVSRTGISRSLVLLIGFVAALILGFAAQQAVVQLSWALRGRTDETPESPQKGGSDDADAAAVPASATTSVATTRQ